MLKKSEKVTQEINKIDTFSPYFFLPFILVLYFMLSIFDFSRFELFNVRESIWPAVFLAIICYYIGVYIIDRLGWTLPTFGISRLGKYVIHFIVLLTIIGLVATMMIFFQGTIGISDESVRRSVDPKLNFLSQLLWFGVLLLISYRMVLEKDMSWKKIIFYGIIFAAVMTIFLLMAYRTPLGIMLFTGFIIFHYCIKRLKLTWFISLIAIIGLLFAMFGFMRVVTEDTSLEFNDRTQPSREQMKEEDLEKLITAEQRVNLTPEWVRAINQEMVTGHIVLSKIIEYTKEEGYKGGEVHQGIFTTILPGEQTSPRMLVTEVVNSLSEDEGKYITRPNRTTTPTFIGQLFLDGGYLLVAIGFLLYGAIISLIYNKMKQDGVNSFHSVAYAFVITLFTISIHTGLLDLIFVLMFGFVILASSIQKTVRNIDC